MWQLTGKNTKWMNLYYKPVPVTKNLYMLHYWHSSSAFWQPGWPLLQETFLASPQTQHFKFTPLCHSFFTWSTSRDFTEKLYLPFSHIPVPVNTTPEDISARSLNSNKQMIITLFVFQVTADFQYMSPVHAAVTQFYLYTYTHNKWKCDSS